MNNIDIWNDLGNLYLKANAIDAAIDAYNKAIEQGYRTGEIYKNLAGAYLCQGNIIDSIPLYQKSIELLSSNEEKAVLFTHLGDCYRRVEDFDNAIAAFKSAIELEPGNPALCLGLNDVQRDLEKMFSFDEYETTPIDNDPNAGSELDMNGDGLVSTDAFDKPLNLETEIIMEQGSPVEGEGAVLSVEGKNQSETVVQEIESAKEQAIQGNSNKLGGIDNLSKLAFETDNNLNDIDFSLCDVFVPDCNEESLPDETLEDEFSIDIEVNREKADGVRVTLLLTLGIMHWRNGNLEEADRILQSAINVSVKIKNNWFEALSWHALALVKTALGNIVGAIHAYLRAVELAPEQIVPWNNIGNLYGRIGEIDEAMSAYQKAIKIFPEDSTSWDGMGDVYTKLGRLDDAIAAYQLGNVFGAHARGIDAIKAYEKAFDFYKFTIASFEEEVNSTQDVIIQSEELIDGVEKQTIFEEQPLSEKNTSGLNYTETPENIMDLGKDFPNSDNTDKMELFGSTDNSELAPPFDIEIDDQISDLTEFLVNQAEFVEQPDDWDGDESTIKTAFSTELEEENKQSGDEYSLESNLSNNLQEPLSFKQEENVQTPVEMNTNLESSEVDLGSSALPDIELIVENQNKAVNFSESAEIGLEKTIIVEAEPENFEIQTFDDSLADSNENLAIDGDFLPEPKAEQIQIHADLIDDSAPDITENFGDSQCVDSTGQSDNSFGKELESPRLSEKKICDSGNSSDELTAIGDYKELELVDAYRLQNRLAQPEESQQHWFVGSEKVSSSGETVELESNILSGGTLPSLNAINESVNRFIEPIDHTAAEQSDNDSIVEVQNPSDLELKIEDEQGESPEAGMLPILTLEPSPKPDTDRVIATIASYEAVVRENPTNDRAWDSLGNLYRITQRYGDAIRAFERAVALEPGKYVYHYQLGTLYASEGKFEEAIREIQNVVELNPSFIFAHCALASYLRKVGKDEEAQSHILIALPQMVKEKEYDRACFESIRGNIDEAMQLLSVALEKKQTTIEWIERDLDLDFIRHDPRYKLLAARSVKNMVNHR